MNTLPAVPDTQLVGEVTGRLQLQPDGSLTVHLQPATQQRVRDVTTQPINPPTLGTGERWYQCCDHHYFGSCGVPTTRAETAALEAYWLRPPWWSPLRWNRRRRTELKREREGVTA